MKYKYIKYPRKIKLKEKEIENGIKSDMTDPDDYEKLEESLNRTKEMFNKFKSYN